MVAPEGAVHVQPGDAILFVDVEPDLLFSAVECPRAIGADDFFTLDPDGVSAIAGHLDGSIEIVDIEYLIAGKGAINRLAGFFAPVTAVTIVRGAYRRCGKREHTYGQS